MENEEEILAQLKFLINCKNDSQAIKLIMQYGIFKRQQIIKKCKDNQ
jgi:hypothetical protein